MFRKSMGLLAGLFLGVACGGRAVGDPEVGEIGGFAQWKSVLGAGGSVGSGGGGIGQGSGGMTERNVGPIGAGGPPGVGGSAGSSGSMGSGGAGSKVLADAGGLGMDKGLASGVDAAGSNPDAMVVPVCGDGICDGGETSMTCCEDCKCVLGATCSNHACDPPCKRQRFDLTNEGSTQTENTASCGLASRPLMAFVPNPSYWLAKGDTLSVTVPLGQSAYFQWVCCWIDSADCFSNNDYTCTINSVNSPCHCQAPSSTVLTGTTCGPEPMVLCH